MEDFFDMQSDDEFNADMEATSTVYSLRPGHVLTQADFDAIQRYDASSRRDHERAEDAFHRGFQCGLLRGGGADVRDLTNEVEEKQVEAITAKALRTFSERDGERLKEAIAMIFHARVYEDGEKAKGISVELVGAIRAAAEIARLVPREQPENSPT